MTRFPLASGARMDVPFVGFVQQAIQGEQAESSWIQLLAPSFAGAITALIATWLAHVFAGKRERDKAILDRREATRIETLKRQLTALEVFAESAMRMWTDLEAAQIAAHGEWRAWTAVSTPQSGYFGCTAYKAIYLSNVLTAEWNAYAAAYNDHRRLAMNAAHAKLLATNDPTNAALRQAYNAASEQLRMGSGIAMPERDALLTAIGAIGTRWRTDSQ